MFPPKVRQPVCPSDDHAVTCCSHFVIIAFPRQDNYHKMRAKIPIVGVATDQPIRAFDDIQIVFDDRDCAPKCARRFSIFGRWYDG
jgi:hypothetical protein